MKKFFFLLISISYLNSQAQENLSPEMLWKLGRVSGIGISTNKQYLVYSVNIPNIELNKGNIKTYKLSLNGGNPEEISSTDNLIENSKLSADGKYMISSDAVKIKNISGADFYPSLTKSNVQIYESLNYRHWDTWEDGKFDHVFLAPLKDGKAGNAIDLLKDQPFDCPQKPFGGDEDFIWNPDSKHVVYVSKKSFGTAYAISTNTDLFEYDITTGTTKNLTDNNKGYDLSPAYNSKGVLAYLSMQREGYEADKQDLILWNGQTKINLTKQRDDIHVESFKWSDDGNSIFFIAPQKGMVHLFQVTLSGTNSKITQLTKGEFEVNGIVGQVGNALYISKVDFNHASEIYKLDLTNGKITQVTHVNDEKYQSIAKVTSSYKMVTTTDGKQMPTWVIYPPNFDKTKKYPTLLFCLGGPQGTTPQYSFRWNFQLMASQGYIVVAPDRRGVFGNGTKWTEGVSKDWGGQAIRDYLSAIDAVSKESYVDKQRLGCVGASYGGFSVFALEALHNGRFKTFISHDGVFDFRSMYGTTDEMWFENFEKGGAYYDKNNAIAQRSFTQSPSNFVDKWNTPILIIQGGKDYRVPIEQGQQAFQAAQLKGIKSRFLYFPDENHWILKAQDALVWHHEFYKWLTETLQ
ncbi:MAG: S9 family peptidase [Bacteroidetes bacterium]|nr:S9 family peptidase [Bacteroidota bacterium]